LTWDCGTGNGQAARALAEHFHRVHATDLSAEQIAQAEIDPRIDYRAAPAEASGLPGHSCDLVTVAQALHWFCGDAFYAEVRRVLKPGGVFAAWTYTLLHGEPALNAVVEDFLPQHHRPLVAAGATLGGLGYRDMPFPFAEIATPDFEIRLEWTLDDLLAYLRTWSATQRYIRERGTDPCVELAIRLGDAWPDAQARKAIIWPIALRCGRMQ
jgi:SAM-dependent methyltransferase